MSHAPTSAASSVLSQRTLIPVSFLICVAPLFYWLTTVAHTTTQNEKDIESIVAERTEFQRGIGIRLDEQYRQLSSVQADVAGIDAKLSILVDYFRQRPPPVRRGP